MIRIYFMSLIIGLSAGAAAGETVVGAEFSEDRSGYPCFTTLTTDADKSVTLQLSNYRDVWSLNFVISDRPSVFRQFFNSRGLRDEDAFKKAFGSVRIGKHDLKLHEATLFETQRQDVDEETAAIFSIEEQHNTAQALGAMADDGVEFPGLVALDGTTESLSDFRSCSFSAMGLQEGESIETDIRSEYRMIFEDAFENWVSNMARAEHCVAARFNDESVAEVVDAAADAFYPGILKVQKRNRYRENLEGMLPLAKLSGMTDAITEGCLMSERLADLSRIPVDMAIEEAAKVH